MIGCHPHEFVADTLADVLEHMHGVQHVCLCPVKIRELDEGGDSMDSSRRLRLHIHGTRFRPARNLYAKHGTRKDGEVGICMQACMNVCMYVCMYACM